MSESNRYYAVRIERVTGALRGESKRLNRALKFELHPVVEDLRTRMANGDYIAWDMTPLRHQPWKVFTEASLLISMAASLEGDEVGWDAWAGRHRLLSPLLDWAPLPRGFGRRFSSRPVPPFYFARRQLLPPEQQTPYVESYPHSFFLRSEFADHIPALLRLIDSYYQELMEEESSPVSTLRPGRPIAKAEFRALVLPDTDEHAQVWQLHRAVPLYNALCHAAQRETDLFCVGY